LIGDLIPLLNETLEGAKNEMKEIENTTDVQNIAVNSVKTTLSVATIASTVLLFTPLFAFGIGGLIGTGVGSVATLAGDEIANYSNGKDIEKIMEKSKIEAKEFEINQKEFLKCIQQISQLLNIKNYNETDFYEKFVKKIFLKLDKSNTLGKKQIGLFLEEFLEVLTTFLETGIDGLCLDPKFNDKATEDFSD